MSTWTFIEQLATIVGMTSLVWAVVVHLSTVRRERISTTLAYWESIQGELKHEKRTLAKKYGTKIDADQAVRVHENGEDRVAISKVLNTYERLSLGVRLKLYDKETLVSLYRENLLSNYDRFEEYIRYRREVMARPKAWEEFEGLVRSIRTRGTSSGTTENESEV